MTGRKQIKRKSLRFSRRLFLRLSKNGALSDKDRAAGEREGARPASQYNNPPQKSLENQGFSSEAAF